MVVLAENGCFSTESTACIWFLAGAQTSKPNVARSLGSSHSGSFGGGIVQLVSVSVVWCLTILTWHWNGPVDKTLTETLR